MLYIENMQPFTFSAVQTITESINQLKKKVKPKKKSNIVSIAQFNRMQSYNSHAKNRQEQQAVKDMLLEKTIEAYGAKYYRLKQGTKDTIDMMCWFASERGFVFAGDDYLAERYEVTDRTVRNVAKTMRELGLVVTVHRESKKQNGRGKPVHIFVDHPYFKYWKKMLQITSFQADFQAEKAEKACGSKEEGSKKIPTYSLPSKDINKDHLMYPKDSTFFKYVKGVPKVVNNLFAGMFQQQLKPLYKRVVMASKSIFNERELIELDVRLGKEERYHIAVEAFETLHRYMAAKDHEGQTMSFDEQCALIYVTAKESFQQLYNELNKPRSVRLAEEFWSQIE